MDLERRLQGGLGGSGLRTFLLESVLSVFTNKPHAAQLTPISPHPFPSSLTTVSILLASQLRTEEMHKDRALPSEKNTLHQRWHSAEGYLLLLSLPPPLPLSRYARCSSR